MPKLYKETCLICIMAGGTETLLDKKNRVLMTRTNMCQAHVNSKEAEKEKHFKSTILHSENEYEILTENRLILTSK